MFYVPLVFVFAVALFTGLSIIILVLSIFSATFYPHKEIYFSTKTFYLNVLPDCRSPKLFQIKTNFCPHARAFWQSFLRFLGVQPSFFPSAEGCLLLAGVRVSPAPQHCLAWLLD